jgi:hypothetical protein
MSNSVAPMPEEFARRLLSHEKAWRKPADDRDSAAFRVCEKLRGPLSKLIGVEGFRALLFRAMALAGHRIFWLSELQIKADGSLAGVDELEATLDTRAVVEGEVVLVGQLLALLVMFIGPALTIGLLHDTWPKWEIDTLE